MKNENFFNFHPTLTAKNPGLKPSKLKNILECPGRQLSHGIPRLGHTIELH